MMKSHNIFGKIRDKSIVIISTIINNGYQTFLKKRLKNDNFSIICSNCIGGIIYNRLGKKFLSPTINLWMKQKDFIKFALDLKYYISLDLFFIETEYDYPVAKLDDITIYFNHATSKEEAEFDWYKRRERINYDNLYLIMYERENLSKEEISLIEKVKCKNKIVITDNENNNLEYALYVKPNLTRNDGFQCLDRDIFGIRTFEKKFDFVKWLNS